jgi:hypothetical protein
MRNGQSAQKDSVEQIEDCRRSTDANRKKQND